ncbi:hypothetical protein A2U01_0053921, partial [Trifolium medium]|nr:hypothetical protein [Trifolium medium]
TIENSSTAETDFVDDSLIDTSMHSPAHDIEVEQLDSQTKNQKNMEFLNQSWANMAEDEEVEMALLDQIDQFPVKANEAQFTMVQARVKKASKNSSVSKTHGTRSKGGISKPFK